MNNNKKVTGIILVAGNSSRYGQNRNKNFEKVSGKTILEYSLDVFDNNKYVDDIVIVSKKDEIEDVKKIIEYKEWNKKIEIVSGGECRKDSVQNGIENTNSDIVVIHDGARPMIKDEYINLCVKEMEVNKGATIGVRSKDTIKIVDDNNIITETTNRANTCIIQTPQCFDRKVLLENTKKITGSEEITDDCMILEKAGYNVKIINGDYYNIKLTDIQDLDVIEKYINLYK